MKHLSVPIFIYHLNHTLADQLCTPKLVLLKLNQKLGVCESHSFVIFLESRIALVKVGLSYRFARFIFVLKVKLDTAFDELFLVYYEQFQKFMIRTVSRLVGQRHPY